MKRKKEKCAFSGKTRFRDHIAAKLAMTRMDTMRTKKRPVRAYYCRHCGGAHLTSRPDRYAKESPA